MADYFEEIGLLPLGRGLTSNQVIHLARIFRDYGRSLLEGVGHDQGLPPPASKDAIDNLEEKEVITSGGQCPICLKEHIVGEIVKGLPCKHTFHSTCILPWLEKTNSCPVCRLQLPTDDEEYEIYRRVKQEAKQRQADLETLHNSMFS